MPRLASIATIASALRPMFCLSDATLGMARNPRNSSRTLCWSAVRGCEENLGGPDCERDDASCEARRRDDAGTSWRRRNEADGVVPPQDGPPWISSQPLRA